MAENDHLSEEPKAETIGDDHPAFDEAAGDEQSQDDGRATVEFDAPAADPTVEQQLAAEKDRVLRLQAELQNTLTRKSRELTDERRYGAMPLMKDILPVLDNVDRAIEAAEKAAGESGDAASGLLDGFRLVRQQLLTVLTQHQCEAIEAVGEAFNPDLHEAILQQPSPDHQEGVVMMQTQTGYKLHDRVVRPSQVIVSSGAPDNS